MTSPISWYKFLDVFTSFSLCTLRNSVKLRETTWKRAWISRKQLKVFKWLKLFNFWAHKLTFFRSIAALRGEKGPRWAIKSKRMQKISIFSLLIKIILCNFSFKEICIIKKWEKKNIKKNEKFFLHSSSFPFISCKRTAVWG